MSCELIPVSVALSDQEYFYSLPLDEMLMHRRATPGIKFFHTAGSIYLIMFFGQCACLVYSSFFTTQNNIFYPFRCKIWKA